MNSSPSAPRVVFIKTLNPAARWKSAPAQRSALACPAAARGWHCAHAPGCAVLRRLRAALATPLACSGGRREAGAPAGSLQDGGAEEEPVAECEEPTRSPGRGLGIRGEFEGAVWCRRGSLLAWGRLPLPGGVRPPPCPLPGRPTPFPQDGGACALRAWPSAAWIPGLGRRERVAGTSRGAVLEPEGKVAPGGWGSRGAGLALSCGGMTVTIAAAAACAPLTTSRLRASGFTV